MRFRTKVVEKFQDFWDKIDIRFNCITLILPNKKKKIDFSLQQVFTLFTQAIPMINRTLIYRVHFFITFALNESLKLIKASIARKKDIIYFLIGTLYYCKYVQVAKAQIKDR